MCTSSQTSSGGGSSSPAPTPVAEALARTAAHARLRRRPGRRRPRTARCGIARPPRSGSLSRRWKRSRGPASTGGEASAVVASQGHYDEQALEVDPARCAPPTSVWSRRARAATTVPEAARSGRRAGCRARSAVLQASISAREPRRKWPCRSSPRSCRCDPASAHADPPGAESSTGADAPATAVDPVCRMEVDIATARHTAEVGGTIYYFCCARCRSRFVDDPARFLASPS